MRINFKKPLRIYLGNFLMLASVLALLFIYFPIINLYFNPPKIQAHLAATNFYITIPKISAQAPVIENVNPWSESDYLPVLQKGVAKTQGSVEPGQDGLIYLFAHSSDVPWHITRYNIAFFKLGDLRIGDLVVLTKNDKDYNYYVYKTMEIWPSDIQYLKEKPSGQELILQTCTPIGTSLKRLLVFAKPI